MLDLLFARLFKRYVSADDIQKKLDDGNIMRFKKSVSYHPTCIISAKAVAHNPTGERKNILLNEEVMVCGELLTFGYGGRIQIGRSSFIGENSRVWSGDSVTIGSYVFVSHNCNIVDTDSHEIDYVERMNAHAVRLKHGMSTAIKGNIKTAPVVVEDNVWISFNVSILKGVTIGKGSIVAAGSVVTKSVPPHCLVAGNPASIIKRLRDENN